MSAEWASFAPAPTPRAFRLALVQMGGVTAVKEDNLRHAKQLIQRAALTASGARQADLVVLPECFNSPYGVDNFDEHAETIGYTPGQPYDISTSQSPSVKMLSAAAKDLGIWLIGGSIPEREDKHLYNTSTVYNPSGELIALHRKVHLFDIDIPNKITFKESSVLTGGRNLTFFDTDFGRIGLGICYDIRFPEMATIAAHQGCVAMIYPSAFNMTTGPLHWELLQRARAVDNQIYVAMCSPARDMSASYHAWGHSLIANPLGEVIAVTDEKESIVYGQIDPQKILEVRANIPIRTQRRYDVYPDITTGSL